MSSSFRHFVLLPACLALLAAFAVPIFSAEPSAEPPPASDRKTSDPKPSGRETKVILVSWDGAGDVLIDRLLAEGKLPHLAALAKRGVRAEHMVGTWPTKTAPSHASIYTGCGSGTHGVTGNQTAYVDDRSHHTVLDSRRGFSSLALQAEPLFVTTATEGLKTTVLAATQYHPHQPIADRLKNRQLDGINPRFRSLSSFEHTILPSGTLTEDDLRPRSGQWTELPAMTGDPLELELQAGDETLFGLVFDHPGDPVKGFDSVLLRQGSRSGDAKQEVLLKPRPASEATDAWSSAFTIHDKQFNGLLHFRLFELAADGSEMILYRRAITAPVGHISESDRASYLASGAASYDDGTRAYDRGRLGKPLMLGGDGEAERRLVETLSFDVEQLITNTRFAWNQWQPDALFHYAPYLDSLGHDWLAVLHPDSTVYRPEVADRLWGVYSQIAGLLDDWLGAMVELAGDDTIVALVSDHGMAYSTHDVAPNRILENAGLLARGEDGRIDLSRTQILAADSSFFLRVNDRSWREGIVPAEERAEVIDKASAALLAARDPETGKALITQVFVTEQLSHLGLGSRGGALYFDTAPGYYPNSRFPDAIAGRSRRPWGSGTHGHWRERRDMHAIFFAAGPGLAHGVVVPAMSQIDVAPTLSRLLGIRPPADACGRVLYEALAPNLRSHGPNPIPGLDLVPGIRQDPVSP